MQIVVLTTFKLYCLFSCSDFWEFCTGIIIQLLLPLSAIQMFLIFIQKFVGCKILFINIRQPVSFGMFEL